MTAPRTRQTNWPDRFRDLLEFSGISDNDLKSVKATGPIIVKYAVSLTDEVYDRIFEFPAAKQFFVDKNGHPDAKRIKDNKDTMIQWLYYLAKAPTNDGFTRYLAAISSMHHTVPSHRPGLPAVPSRFVIGTISYYQTRLSEILQDELDDPDEASRASTAWNKFLMVSLDLLLVAYLSDS
ncbi:hypothetical protein FIM12_04135 [SAR202 cluster bacterium AD-804-J14_MRT_500m]|nr:hypothetical protein [SAR202 cluster bacterium AD-804-J14_MRT_500m]